jgi:maltose alpha-D-glucosyltransferase/alpha-amylase
VRREAEQLAASQNLVLGHFASLLKRKLGAMKIRVHGDFHLGQVLNTGKDFIIIDFEGDPRRLLGERALKRSPLADVAAMLRSFDYAASTALAREVETDAHRLSQWTRPWVEAACRSYLMGYLTVARGASFLPSDPASGRLLLAAFLLDKAISEIGYELSYRPDFLPIPLRAVLRMLEAPENGLEVWTQENSMSR